MKEKATEVCAAVLRRITPKKDERERIQALADKLERKVVSASRELDVKARARVEGSVAKDTWISGDPDVDVFMRVPISIPRKSLGDICLRIARRATEGSKQIERFAEHPYLEAVVEGTRVNIVPCYAVKRGEWLSATDRTPFHTDYLKARLDARLRSEARLLKKFMKGIGVYGAEIKVGGFSGYLCELLILHHKSFINTLKTFAQHGQRMVIDIEEYYKDRKYELDLLFNEPLVIIDPVDKARNVASAVRKQKLHTFVAAARAFLKNPAREFFYPPPMKPWPTRKMKQSLAKRGSTIVFVTFGKVDAVPDILWGQLYKSQRSLRKLIQLSDFDVLRDVAWSDERTLNVFVLELGQRFLSSAKKHLGPPLEKEHECEKFLKKYQASSVTVCGPYVEEGRWIVMIRRRFTDAVALLSERLKDGGRNSGVAEQLAQVIRGGFKICVGDEIVEVYEENSEFAGFLTDFVSGKPRWLIAAETE